MRKFGLFNAMAGAMAVAAALVQQAVGAGTSHEGSMSPRGLVAKPARHRGKGRNSARGKGAINPPKKRANMNHISKRTRRKHRRAA